MADNRTNKSRAEKQHELFQCNSQSFKYIHFRVVHKGRLQKIPAILPSPLVRFCPHMAYSSCHLQTSASSIRHCSMVWQCNSRCSNNLMLIGGLICGLICGSCKQNHPGSQTYVGILVPTHIIFCGTNLQLILRHHSQRASGKHTGIIKKY